MPSKRKLCVVAGFGPGVGQAVAGRFAREGFDLALIARRQTELDAAVQSFGRGVRAIGYSADLGRHELLPSLFDSIRADLGHPDVLVYNAARLYAARAMDISPKVFMDELALSVGGAIACAQCVYPAMRDAGGGTPLFTGGGLALRPESGEGAAALVAGKSALRGLVFAMSRELAPDNIHVATVTIAGQVRPDTAFSPALISESYWTLHQQRRDEWQTERVFKGSDDPSGRTS